MYRKTGAARRVARCSSCFSTHQILYFCTSQADSLKSGYDAVKARLTGAVHNIEPKEVELSIDTSALYRFPKHPHRENADNPLSKHLSTTIRMRGPLPVSNFMHEVLRNPVFGYYITNTVLGKEGDFVTSPEISQMFGEMIGIWLYNSWEKLGSPLTINIIELGPGRGTLLADILRVAQRLGFSKRCNFHVHLVEVSPVLRSLQASSFGCNPEQVRPSDSAVSSPVLNGIYGIPFQWHNDVAQVPKGTFFLIAHEFFDALGIHQFQYTEKGWRELLVDVNDEGDDMFKIVVAPSPTPASTLLTKGVFLKQSSPTIGDIMEICAEGMGIVEQIASRMATDEGAALIIDYGNNFPSGRSTLRGIRNHITQSIFQNVGDVDISADVDFEALKRAALSRGASCYGPITQRAFLKGMGIDARMARLLSKHHANPEQTHALCTSYERIIDPEPNMGLAYKVLALFPSSLPTPEPFGAQH